MSEDSIVTTIHVVGMIVIPMIAVFLDCSGLLDLRDHINDTNGLAFIMGLACWPMMLAALAVAAVIALVFLTSIWISAVLGQALNRRMNCHGNPSSA